VPAKKSKEGQEAIAKGTAWMRINQLTTLHAKLNWTGWSSLGS